MPFKLDYNSQQAPKSKADRPNPCTHFNESLMEIAVNQHIIEPLHQYVYLLIVDGPAVPPFPMTGLR
jgi:hypothetical protein